MPQYDTLFLDLDGTLVDTSRVFFLGLKSVALRYGKQFDDKDEKLVSFCKEKISQCRLLDVLSRVFSEENPTMLQKLKQEFKAVQQPLYTVSGNVTLYPTWSNVLRALHQQGVKLAIVTSRDALLSKTILQNEGVLDLFSLIVGEDSLPFRKPQPQPLLYAIETMKADLTRSLFIGDSIPDFLCGINAKTSTGIVSWSPSVFAINEFKKELTNTEYDVSTENSFHSELCGSHFTSEEKEFVLRNTFVLSSPDELLPLFC